MRHRAYDTECVGLVLRRSYDTESIGLELYRTSDTSDLRDEPSTAEKRVIAAFLDQHIIITSSASHFMPDFQESTHYSVVLQALAAKTWIPDETLCQSPILYCVL